MKFRRPVDELIRRRSSRRKYVERAIEAKARQSLGDYVGSAHKGPFGARVRLGLLAATAGDRDALRGLGTYGFIRGAPGFIVGAVSRDRRDMEDFGFVMEQAILVATDLELGTCWLGGTFTRSSFAEKFELSAGESMPAVVAVGEATERHGTFEQVVRWGAGSKRRKPWHELFFLDELARPLTEVEAGEWSEPLEMVRLGPSASNRQPWRVVKEPSDDGVFHLLLERYRAYGAINGPLKMADLQRIDMGIAMCHFDLSAREAGLPGQWCDESSSVGSRFTGVEYIATWR